MNSLIGNNANQLSTNGMLGQLSFLNIIDIQSGTLVRGLDCGTENLLRVQISDPLDALIPGMIIGVDNIVATNTGEATLAVNSFESLPITSKGMQLSKNELASHSGAYFRLSQNKSEWELLYSSQGATTVEDATAPSHAVSLGQFSSQLVTQGYSMLPTGQITEWGVWTTDSTGKVVVTLQKISSAIHNITITPSSGVIVYYTDANANSFVINSEIASSPVAASGFYSVIGI